MRRVACVALLLLAPLAAAAEEARLEDASLDAFPPIANAWGDITAGWMELANDTTLRLNVQMALLPEVQQGVGYMFLFSDGTRDWFAALVTPGTLRYLVGPWVDDEEGPWGGDDTTGAYTTGAGGVVSIDLPISKLSRNVTTLSHPRAYSVDIKPDAIPNGFLLFTDSAEGDATLTIRDAPDPAASPAANATSVRAGEGVNDDLAPAAVATPDNAGSRETPAPLPLLGLVGAALLTARFRRR